MDFSSLFLRVAALGLLAFSLPACSPHSAPNSAFGSGAVQTQAISRRYGAITDKGLTGYLDEVARRLREAAARTAEARGIDALQIQILATRMPIAVSPGGGFILLSRGLLESLVSEAELAFVLSHELGHEQLGHLAMLAGQHADSAELQRYELAADHYGAGLMALAGYDPRAAAAGLIHSYRALARTLNAPLEAATAPAYPALDQRVAALQDYVAASGWQPPGIVDRRDFRVFQLRLRSLQ